MKSPQQLAHTRDDQFIGKTVSAPYAQEKGGKLYKYLGKIVFDAEMSRHVAESLRKIGRKLLEGESSN